MVDEVYDKEFWEDVFGWDDVEYFPKAYSLAADVHKEQKRDEGTPYITHIDGVLDILRNELGVNSDIILSVAALHDVLEDSDKTYDDLKSMFNKHIADAVLLLTKQKGQDLEVYLKNIANSDFKWLMKVKLADRLHNLRCLRLTKDRGKIDRKVKETKIYYMRYAKDYEYIYEQFHEYIKQLEIAV